MMCYVGGCQRLVAVGTKDPVCTLLLQAGHCHTEQVELTAASLAQA